MKLYRKPILFDGSKFAARYGLNGFTGDFGVTTIEGEEWVYVNPILADDPPIFEAPDTPGPTLTQRLTTLETEMKDLKEKVIIK